MKFILLSVLYGISSLNPGSNELRTNHAIYVSVLEIEQGQNNDKGILRVKIFGDDLEDAIFNQAQQRPDLLNGDCNQSKILIGDYFKKHLMFKIDGK